MTDEEIIRLMKDMEIDCTAHPLDREPSVMFKAMDLIWELKAELEKLKKESKHVHS